MFVEKVWKKKYGMKNNLNTLKVYSTATKI